MNADEALNTPTWTRCRTPVFTFDWSKMKTDILVRDESGTVHDPVKVSALPDQKRPAVLITAFRSREVS